MKKGRGIRLLLYGAAVLLLLGFAAEVTLRVQGHRPWNPGASKLERVDGGPMFLRDETLGYQNVPGEMRLRVNGELEVTLHHDAEGHRITHVNQDSIRPRKLWVLGCSFAHGYGVQDHEAFPWLLQQMQDEYEVTNFGTDGYGPHQGLMQVQAALAKGDTADVVVLCYGGFHDQRVTCSPFWQKAISGQENMEQWEYPWIRKGKAGKSKIGYSPFYPWIEWSAAMNAMDNSVCAHEEDMLQSEVETEAVIRQLDQLVKSAGGSLVVVGIWRHPDTKAMLDRLSGLSVTEASPDPALTILPDDLHPDAAGHAQIAQRVFTFLIESGHMKKPR